MYVKSRDRHVTKCISLMFYFYVLVKLYILLFIILIVNIYIYIYIKLLISFLINWTAGICIVVA